MPVIEVSHLTKDYGHGRGVFDVSIKVEQGMCYGCQVQVFPYRRTVQDQMGVYHPSEKLGGHYDDQRSNQTKTHGSQIYG